MRLGECCDLSIEVQLPIFRLFAFGSLVPVTAFPFRAWLGDVESGAQGTRHFYHIKNTMCSYFFGLDRKASVSVY